MALRWDNIALFAFVIIVIVILIILWRYPTLLDSSQFGTWKILSVGSCISSNQHCNTTGVSATTEICEVNPVTGYGCIDNNQQYFGLRITNSPCTPPCRFSIWQDITPADQPCVANGPTNTSDCVLTNTPGLQTRTLQCVGWDGTGANLCTDVNIPGFNQPQTFPVVSAYNLGDTITYQQACSNYPNPICGNWVYNKPLYQPAGLQTPCQAQTSTSCTFNPSLLVQQQCFTNGVEEGFDSLLEGYYLDPMTCLYADATCPNNQAGISPTPTYPVISNTCQTLVSGNNAPCSPLASYQCNQVACFSDTITPTQVIDQTIPADAINDGVTCSESNNSNNPTCLTLCRKFSTVSNIGSDWDLVLGKISIAIIPGVGYLAPISTPGLVGGPTPLPLQDFQVLPGDQLQPVNLVIIPYGYSQRYSGCPAGPANTCASDCLMLNSAMWLFLGARSLTGTNTLTFQMMGNIPGNYNGWIQQVTSTTSSWQWQQAFVSYDMTYGVKSTGASTFSATLASVQTTGLPPLPQISSIASIQLGQPLIVTNIIAPGVPVTVNSLDLYNFNTTLSGLSRINRQANNCVLQFCSNPTSTIRAGTPPPLIQVLPICPS